MKFSAITLFAATAATTIRSASACNAVKVDGDWDNTFTNAVDPGKYFLSSQVAFEIAFGTLPASYQDITGDTLTVKHCSSGSETTVSIRVWTGRQSDLPFCGRYDPVSTPDDWKTGDIIVDESSTCEAAVVCDTDPTLDQKWNISEDVSFEYSSLSFSLGYTISNFIHNVNPDDDVGMARTSIYDDRCKDEGTLILPNTGMGISALNNDYSQIEVSRPAKWLFGEMERDVMATITIDPNTISANSLIYSEDTSSAQVTAEIRFCVRFSLYTDSATSIEVNFLETLVTLNVDLTDGFEIGSIAVEPRDRLVRTANQVYLVQAYRCDTDDNQINDLTPINQGTVVKVCVLPDNDALNDGIKMRSIDDFTWSRVVPNVINQPAIIGPNKKARNDLTSITCVPGSALCSFETILFAAFYTTPGAVAGSGVASMQFGTVNNGPDTRRGLRGEDEERMLQEEPAAAAEFELDFDVAQASPYGNASGAASFGVIASVIASFVVAVFM